MDISEYRANPQSFDATIQKSGSKALITIPFDPNVAWGQKERHYLHGTVNGMRLRATLQEEDGDFVISVGAAARRDMQIDIGDTVSVTVEPEGPQLYNMADDIVTALAAEPEATAFFNSLATHYRKNYVNWIEDAKRPETRAKRIEESVAALKAEKQKR